MAITTHVSKSVQAAGPAATDKGAMAMVTTLFFMWGFVTCLNDILIPHLKAIFDLNYAEVMLVQFAFFSGYFIFAMPAGKFIEWIGYKRTMVMGLLTMAAGALMFLPAASLPAFAVFLAALIVVAAGMTALQVSANPYVSVLGPPQTASSRLNLTQAFNSLGTTVAPYFGSLLILSTIPKSDAEVRAMSEPALHAYRLHEAATVKFPYVLIAATLVALALVISFYKLPVISTVEDTTHGQDPHFRHPGSIWKQRHLVLGVIGIFLYVGAEVAIGSFLVNYFAEPNIGNMPVKVAATYVSFYWGGAMVGRFIGAAVLQKLRPGSVLGTVAVVAGILVLISMLSYGFTAMWVILLVGLFNSVMFPTIFTLGIVGGAIIPVVQGVIADSIGIHHAFILPVLCYLYIAYYGFRGSRPHTATA